MTSIPMTWKSTTILSGITVLATWLVSASAPRVDESTASVVSPLETATPASIDIEREAARLRTRLRQEIEYREPARDPFRFGERPVTPPPTRLSLPPVGASRAAEAPVPYVPPIRLSGLASDVVEGGAIQRTAILSTSFGVFLAREGDRVADDFEVMSIGDDSVELLELKTGAVLQVVLPIVHTQ